MDMKSKEKLVYDVATWIVDNIENDLCVTQIANKSGYSKWYFQKMFKSVTGTTIGKFTSSIRFSKVKRELSNPNMRIIDISVKHGFNSQQSFSRAFKKFHNLTPSDYRRLFIIA